MMYFIFVLFMLFLFADSCPQATGVFDGELLLLCVRACVRARVCVYDDDDDDDDGDGDGDDDD